MVTLPFDIHAAILETVYDISQCSTVHFKTLASSALVCRSWTSVAQRLLFRHIPSVMATEDWRKDLQCQWIPLLLRTLRQNPVLGAYVRRLGMMLQEPNMNDHITILDLCPHIFSIYIISAHQDDPQWSSCLVRLRSLKIQPTALLVVHGDTTAIAQLLDLWPSIRHLTVSMLKHDNLGPLPPLSGLLHSVRVLSQTPHDPAVLAWILSSANPYSAIRDIDIGHRLPDMPADILQNVRSIRSCPTVPAYVLQRMSRLEEITVNTISSLSQLPRSIRHVGYTDVSGGTEAAHSLVRALRTLPELQWVSATRNSSLDVLEILEMACREMGINFIVHQASYIPSAFQM